MLRAKETMTRTILSFSLFFLMTSFHVVAQLPDVAACGLPAEGAITQTVTYTLTADCVQTGFLEFQTANTTLTINGAGYTVSGPSNFVFLRLLGSTSTANLSQLTIDGQGDVGAHLVSVYGTLVANQVTFRGANDGLALIIAQEGNATLTSVLFEDSFSGANSINGNGSALQLARDATVAVNSAVFRRNLRGGAAVRVAETASLTATGCLTFSGNAPYNIRGAWTDNSSGRCSGAIGNGDQVESPPALQACGLPAAGVLDTSATYTLRADCAWNGLTIVSENVEITIDGNGYTISSSNTSYALWIAGNATVEFNNVALDRLRIWNYGMLRGNGTVTRGAAAVKYVNTGQAHFTNSLFEDNVSTASTSVYFGWAVYDSGVATFTHTVFRNNTSTRAALRNISNAGVIQFFGCLTFENNVPTAVDGDYDDFSSGPCPVPFEPLVPEALTSVIEQQRNAPRPASAASEVKAETIRACFQQLGAIGLICRRKDGDGALEVWSIDASSNGTLALFLPFDVVDRQQTQGLITTSLEGRLRVQLIGPECVKREDHGLNPRVVSAECIGNQLAWLSAAGPQALGEERYVAISLGPSPEGKVHHAIFDNSLAGHIIGTVDTVGPLPPVAATADKQPTTPRNLTAPFVQSQPTQADGSIVYVVQAGDTVYAIALAYDVSPDAIIARNNLANQGNHIAIGQVLVIRDP